MDDEFFDDSEKKPLSQLGVSGSRKHNAGYSVFIRWMRRVLPLVALCLIALVFSWNQFESDPIPETPKAEKTARTIGKNELLNPEFESMDEKGQPYKITAKRALQGQSAEDDLVILEAPMADIAMEDGSWLAITALQSAFRQATKRLLLKGEVEIFHDQGYTLYTEELDVDMAAGTAKTDLSVQVQGPAGTIDAVGMDADRVAGVLIFKGPAKLVLNEGAL